MLIPSQLNGAWWPDASLSRGMNANSQRRKHLAEQYRKSIKRDEC